MRPGEAIESLVLETDSEIETAFDALCAVELELVNDLSEIDIKVVRNKLEDSEASLELNTRNSRIVFIALEQATSNPDFPSQAIRFTAGDMLNDYYRKKRLSQTA
jgi:hypothetical protein